MLRLLSSLKTTLALVAALAALSAWGSFAIQARPDDYAAIEAGVLLDWLLTRGAELPSASWWIVALIVVTALLCVNTVVCSAGRLARAFRHNTLSLRTLSAHLAHLGFLLVLAAHLVGSVAGFRSDGHAAFRGGGFVVPQRPGWAVEVGKVAVDFAPQGYPTSLDADLTVRDGTRTVAQGAARINHPVMAEGVAVYLKNAETTLRGWQVGAEGLAPTLAELGKPLTWGAGTLVVTDWSRNESGFALLLRWVPRNGSARQGWVPVAPGAAFPLPDGPVLTWGELAVEPLGTFDVRYDPGAPLALAGGLVLSLSLVPLLWPRRRPGRAVPDPAPSPHPDSSDGR